MRWKEKNGKAYITRGKHEDEKFLNGRKRMNCLIWGVGGGNASFEMVLICHHKEGHNGLWRVSFVMSIPRVLFTICSKRCVVLIQREMFARPINWKLKLRKG